MEAPEKDEMDHKKPSWVTYMLTDFSNKCDTFFLNIFYFTFPPDLYQITMAYAYWKSGKTDDSSVFDLYFRKNPFDGEFTIFAGLDECLKFLDNFRYTTEDIAYLKQTLPEGIEDAFFDYLGQLTAAEVTLHAIAEGSVVFPRVPIIKVEGPLIIVQLLETTLLTLVNYARYILFLLSMCIFHNLNYYFFFLV